jgi:hypothetical protein
MRELELSRDSSEGLAWGNLGKWRVKQARRTEEPFGNPIWTVWSWLSEIPVIASTFIPAFDDVQHSLVFGLFLDITPLKMGYQRYRLSKLWGKVDSKLWLSRMKCLHWCPSYIIRRLPLAILLQVSRILCQPFVDTARLFLHHGEGSVGIVYVNEGSFAVNRWVVEMNNKQLTAIRA